MSCMLSSRGNRGFIWVIGSHDWHGMRIAMHPMGYSDDIHQSLHRLSYHFSAAFSK